MIGRTARYVPVAVVTALVVEIGLRTMPLSSLARAAGVRIDLARRSVAEPSHPPVGPLDAARLHAVQVVMRRWPWGERGPCLRQALVAGRLLRHLQPSLRLGMGYDAQGVTGHAWVIIDGLALDPDASLWTPFLGADAA